MPNQKITFVTILILINVLLAILIIRSPKFQSMFDDNYVERQKLTERFCLTKI